MFIRSCYLLDYYYYYYYRYIQYFIMYLSDLTGLCATFVVTVLCKMAKESTQGTISKQCLSENCKSSQNRLLPRSNSNHRIKDGLKLVTACQVVTNKHCGLSISQSSRSFDLKANIVKTVSQTYFVKSTNAMIIDPQQLIHG